MGLFDLLKEETEEQSEGISSRFRKKRYRCSKADAADGRRCGPV